jgi:hypothetical protein
MKVIDSPNGGPKRRVEWFLLEFSPPITNGFENTSSANIGLLNVSSVFSTQFLSGDEGFNRAFSPCLKGCDEIRRQRAQRRNVEIAKVGIEPFTAVLGRGFEPLSSARKAKMIGRTTPTRESAFGAFQPYHRLLFTRGNRLNGTILYKTCFHGP